MPQKYVIVIANQSTKQPLASEAVGTAPGCSRRRNRLSAFIRRARPGVSRTQPLRDNFHRDLEFVPAVTIAVAARRPDSVDNIPS